MKKIISLFLSLVVMFLMTTASFAATGGEEYYTVPVEYSDNIGQLEQLDVMIQNNNVFVKANMLAERLGYAFGENDVGAVIYNKDMSNGLPFSITQFKYNSTQVSHMLFSKMIDTYKAPFASVKNSEGSWIPLEYSLLIIHSGMMITDDALLIDIPTKRIVDCFYDVAKNSVKYNFDWADDFGYTETGIKVLGGSSHLVNVFNGLLGLDGASWATLFQQFVGSMAAYDNKYGENLAMLLCTESDKELHATIDKMNLLVDLLDKDGELGKMLSYDSKMLDFQVGTLYRQCEAVLKGVKSGNSSAAAYSRSYQALENALDRQAWFSHTGGNILDVQKGLADSAGNALFLLDLSAKVLEVVGYAQEFQNQDDFSLAALTNYLKYADGGLELPEAMKKSMVDYSEALSSRIGGYMTKRFVDNIDQWVMDAVSKKVHLHEVLGTQATAALLAWNIISRTWPFVTNGLSSADNFELALYALVFQGDTYLNYLSMRDTVFGNAGSITAENMYNVTQYCYIYLKSCYITREAALASLENKTNSTKERIQPLVDYQNSINNEIAKILVRFKDANKANEGCVFGFLPSDNSKYLGVYDDGKLISWATSNHLVKAEIVASGVCGDRGDNVTWTLDADGTLDISGNGVIVNDVLGGRPPVGWIYEGYTDEIKKVVIHSGITSVEWNSFAHCSNLTTVTLPSSLTFIDVSVFEDCGKLSDVYYSGTKAQWEQVQIDNELDGNVPLLNADIHCSDGDISPKEIVPAENRCGDALTWELSGDGTLTIQGTGEMWDFDITTPAPWWDNGEFIKKVILEDGVTSVGYRAFEGYDDTVNLTSVTISSTVTEIHEFAFAECVGLKDVYYSGSEVQWRQIQIHNDWDDNAFLLNATIHYNTSGS